MSKSMSLFVDYYYMIFANQISPNLLDHVYLQGRVLEDAVASKKPLICVCRPVVPALMAIDK